MFTYTLLLLATLSEFYTAADYKNSMRWIALAKEGKLKKEYAEQFSPVEQTSFLWFYARNLVSLLAFGFTLFFYYSPEIFTVVAPVLVLAIIDKFVNYKAIVPFFIVDYVLCAFCFFAASRLININ